MILYLHGFLSTPQSRKAVQLRAALEQAGLAHHWCCPQLPTSPLAAAALIDQLAQSARGPLVVVGSSLGGFYATWLAERTGCPALLINPAVKPAQGLAARLGEVAVAANGEQVVLDAAFLNELQQLQLNAMTQPQRYFLLACTGDEVLDYRDMIAFFRDCPTHLVTGSDHAVTDFAQYLPMVLQFCASAVADADCAN